MTSSLAPTPQELVVVFARWAAETPRKSGDSWLKRVAKDTNFHSSKMEQTC